MSIKKVNIYAHVEQCLAFDKCYINIGYHFLLHVIYVCYLLQLSEVSYRDYLAI